MLQLRFMSPTFTTEKISVQHVQLCPGLYYFDSRQTVE